MFEKRSRPLSKTHALAWAATILLLPLTSLPLITRLARTHAVAAPASLFVGWLALAWFAPYVLRRGTLPRQTLPFLGFVTIALIASARAFFLPTPSFKNQSLLPEIANALLTLGIGSAFYLIGATWPRSLKRLNWTLRLLNGSGLLLVGWALLQGYFVVVHNGGYPLWMKHVQGWLSVRRLFYNRVTGFAFEPSWLAHQLNMFYLPYWLAASVLKFSAQPFRLGKFSLENLLLAGGVVVLFLSISRVGWLAFGLMVSYLVLRWVTAFIGRMQRRVIERAPGGTRFRRILPVCLTVGLVLAFVLIAIGALIGLYQVASRIDPRLVRMVERLNNVNGFYDLSNKLLFAERVIYWGTGWEIFNHYPFLGVGLGGAGFYFPDEMPSFGMKLVEIQNLFFRRSFIPNTKSLWSRLLAETGIIGFSFFITWLYVLWRSARAVSRSAQPVLQAIALSGTFVLLAFLIEGFSVDSFALPYLWFSLGLLSAAASVFARQ